ncbi:MAG TPA: 50S ribosomal protein L18 [Trueperaceae bacterium]
MKSLSTKERRQYRTRRRLKRPVETGRMRLSVFRSARYIYAQVIDDRNGRTLAEANSRTLDAAGDKTAQAREVGKALAEKALAAGVKDVVFDRGSYRYHGRVKALADGAREGGLNF